MTPRLYYDDPWLVELEATVIAHGVHAGRPSVILDRTAFYPEGGGQAADHGVLGGARVIDVQVDDADVVHHVVDLGASGPSLGEASRASPGELPPVGTTVAGRIDRARRRAHMALHTGQHLLSRALEDVAGGVTVSARLGERSCTIDLDRDGVPEARVAEAEALVNAVVDDDLVVRAWMPEPGELAALPLRRAPKVTERIRLIDAGGFDLTPCGGTHCTRTGQVGLVAVTGLERVRGKVRVVFEAGARARRLGADDRARLAAVAAALGAGPGELVATVERLRADLAGAREALGAARTRLAEPRAIELRARAAADPARTVMAAIPGAPIELLRMIATRVLEVPGAAVVLIGEDDEGHPVLVARAEGSTVHCGDTIKALAAAAGGRGGGRPERAEGRVPAGTLLDRLLTPG